MLRHEYHLGKSCRNSACPLDFNRGPDELRLIGQNQGGRKAKVFVTTQFNSDPGMRFLIGSATPGASVQPVKVRPWNT